MKSTIHPKYFTNAKVTCACGNTFETGSTVETINTDICAACHPFFTGKMKFIDTMGRVEKFEKQLKSAKANTFVKKSARKQAKEAQEEARPSTLKEMIQQERKKHDRLSPGRA